LSPALASIGQPNHRLSNVRPSCAHRFKAPRVLTCAVAQLVPEAKPMACTRTPLPDRSFCLFSQTNTTVLLVLPPWCLRHRARLCPIDQGQGFAFHHDEQHHQPHTRLHTSEPSGASTQLSIIVTFLTIWSPAPNIVVVLDIDLASQSNTRECTSQTIVLTTRMNPRIPGSRTGVRTFPARVFVLPILAAEGISFAFTHTPAQTVTLHT
jgi:hypothetical protein